MVEETTCTSKKCYESSTVFSFLHWLEACGVLHYHSTRSVPFYGERRGDSDGITSLRRGALDGGSPMSHADFMKCPCPLSLFFFFALSISILEWSHDACQFQETPYITLFPLLSLGSMSLLDFLKRTMSLCRL